MPRIVEELQNGRVVKNGVGCTSFKFRRWNDLGSMLPLWPILKFVQQTPISLPKTRVDMGESAPCSRE